MKSFDELKELYEKDPEAWEKEREKIIEEFISSMPPERQVQARQFQFRIDSETRHIKNPLVKTQKMFNMMIEKASKLVEIWNRPAVVEEKPKTNAQIIDFRRKK